MDKDFYMFLMRSEIGESIEKLYGFPVRERMDFYDKWVRTAASDEQRKTIARLYAQFQIEREDTCLLMN